MREKVENKEKNMKDKVSKLVKRRKREYKER